jgi:maltooligosyltrehalose trehalohydrolase
LGERFGQRTDPARYRAASLLLLLVPYTPLLFMGQEWNASSPFLFFTDHNPELGWKVTEGRRREFRSFSAFAEPEARTKIPDPQAEKTFLDSKLKWAERHTDGHAAVLTLYREALKLRKTHRCLKDRSRAAWRARQLSLGVAAIIYGSSGGPRLAVVTNLQVTGSSPWPISAELLRSEGGNWQMVLSSNDARFGGEGDDTRSPATVVFETQ